MHDKTHTTPIDNQFALDFKNHFDSFLPVISINCVIFRFHEKELQVLVGKLPIDIKDMLPGGYVKKEESIDDAAARIIHEHLNVDDIPLVQFGTFGSVNREFSKTINKFSSLGLPQIMIDWVAQRFISIAYYGILEEGTFINPSNPFFERYHWQVINDQIDLGFDHTEITIEAHKNLQKDIISKPLLLRFMPKQFTIPLLQILYEIVLQRKVDRGNFRKRILKSDFLIKVGEKRENGSRRASILYEINEEKYSNCLTDAMKMGF